MCNSHSLTSYAFSRAPRNRHIFDRFEINPKHFFFHWRIFIRKVRKFDGIARCSQYVSNSKEFSNGWSLVFFALSVKDHIFQIFTLIVLLRLNFPCEFSSAFQTWISLICVIVDFVVVEYRCAVMFVHFYVFMIIISSYVVFLSVSL